eukprot:gene1372-1575_t
MSNGEDPEIFNFLLSKPKFDQLTLRYFLNTFFGADTLKGTTIKLPEMNFANKCWGRFANYPSVTDCPMVADAVPVCQAKGKVLILALGGAIGTYGFTSAAQATEFANTLWNMYLGGTDSRYPRPFGATPLDGVDLDIENGNNAHYDTFVNSLSTLYASGSKKYYITGAPQCVYPDASMGPGPNTALSTGKIDIINVQFYNNYCGISTPNAFNYKTWADWVKESSPKSKIYIGAPASASSAGQGSYISERDLEKIVSSVFSDSAFGGVMLWDVSTAENNIVNGSLAYGAAISQYIKKYAPSPSTSTTLSTTTTPSTTTTKPTTTTTTTTTTKPTTTTPSTTTTGSTTTTTTPSTTTTSSTSTPSSGATTTPEETESLSTKVHANLVLIATLVLYYVL